MKIAVLLATRGKPDNAFAITQALRMLASGEHDVEYVIGVDTDDTETWQMLCYQFGIEPFIRPRPLAPMTVWNRMAAEIKADAYVQLGDDVVPATAYWDRLVANAVDKFGPLTCFALNETGQPNVATLFFMSARWVELVGQIYEAVYPFWFADTALAELHSFVTGQRFTIANNFIVVSKQQQPNPDLREIPFWWRVYRHMRPWRLAKAAEIRKVLGLPDPDLTELLRMYDERDARDEAHQNRLALSLPYRAPSERYLKIKANAEAMLGDK